MVHTFRADPSYALRGTNRAGREHDNAIIHPTGHLRPHPHIAIYRIGRRRHVSHSREL